MAHKKSVIFGLIGLGIVIGLIFAGTSIYAIKATSTTEFCVSCHEMDIPFEEYQSSHHFMNREGIRAGCADCHIPQSPTRMLWAKIMAGKDLYHHFVTGKIDTEEKFEEHRQELAEMVWHKMESQASETCRSCHSFEAMDFYAQSDGAAKMHQMAVEEGQSCIECHKGVAHFLPEVEMDSEAMDELREFSTHTSKTAKVVYPIEMISAGELGRIMPATKLEVVSHTDTTRTVKVSGYQLEGAESVMYLAKGQRSIIAVLSEEGQAALEAGEFTKDDYDNNWRPVSLTSEIDGPVIADRKPLWDYAEKLDNVYCGTCHAVIHGDHFTVNAWGPVAKSMAARTDISDEDLEILTKFFQYHAKDWKGEGH